MGARGHRVGIIIGLNLRFFKVSIGNEMLVAHLHLGEAVAWVEDGKDEDGEHVHTGLRC